MSVARGQRRETVVNCYSMMHGFFPSNGVLDLTEKDLPR
jgi:hypothetical protein